MKKSLYMLALVICAFSVIVSCGDDDEPVKVSSITLSATELSMFIGDNLTLKATVAPGNAENTGYIWTTSNDSVASVSSSGTITALAVGSAVITCTAKDGSGVTATCNITVDYEYVDLGLPSGTLWAKTNIGAEKETDAGQYFSWGMTTPYKFNEINNPTSRYDDGNNELKPADDAATVNWGSNWQTPDWEQQVELHEKCTWTWDETNRGYTVTGPNGNSIFLPAAGYHNGNNYGDCLWDFGSKGYYMSRTFTGLTYAYALHFRQDYIDHNAWFYYYYGYTVRPVRVK